MDVSDRVGFRSQDSGFQPGAPEELQDKPKPAEKVFKLYLHISFFFINYWILPFQAPRK